MSSFKERIRKHDFKKRIKNTKPKNTEYYIKAFMENMEIDNRLWEWKYKVSQATKKVFGEFHGKIVARSSIFEIGDHIDQIIPVLTGGIRWNLQEYVNSIERETHNPKFALLTGYNLLAKFAENIEKTFEKTFGISMGDYYPSKKGDE